MDIFGHCPAHDEFYLVVCNHCSQVVKPQAFQKHCGEPGNSGNGYSTPWCWEQHRECHRGWLWGYSLREGTVVGGLVWAKGGLFPSHPVPSRPDPNQPSWQNAGTARSASSTPVPPRATSP